MPVGAARYVGRVGGLAVALGMGAAAISGVAIANADTTADQTGDTSSSAARPAGPSNSAPRTPATDRASRPVPRNPRAAVDRSAARAAAASSPGPASADTPADLAVPPARQDRSSPVVRRLPLRNAPPPRRENDVDAGIASVPVPVTGRVPAAATAPAAPVVTGSAGSPASAAVAAPRALVANPAAASTRSVDAITAADIARLAPEVALLVVSALAQTVAMVAVASAGIALPSPLTAAPTLVLNGYDLVPNSTETVTGYYGRWTYLPGAPSLIQGRQRFGVVDPASGNTLGTFDALVSRGNGYNYQELLVTATDATDVGTAAGQVPPVGSAIASLDLGLLGWTYTSMPTESGDLISFSLRTPFGEIALPLTFDAANGIADHTVDNRPMDLGNGYLIAPADPTGETIIGRSGILPFFTTVQGNQEFKVLDSDGEAVGSFDGVFTTTWDLAGVSTQAVLVAANDGTNVGTAAGQVPPVGTVYNVMYIGDSVYLYSSMPAPSGDVVTFTAFVDDRVFQVPLKFLNASSEPVARPLIAPDGYRFVPVGVLRPTGVNGLPPREVQIQGYQQFDVYDSRGTRLGRIDADVSNQWDLLGIHSQAILVTDVAGDVPPVGSTFNWVSLGGWGVAHSTVPAASADVTSYKLLTPLGDIVFPAIRSSAAGRTDLVFFSPFTTL